METIFCTNPTVIRNPQFPYLLANYEYIVTPSGHRKITDAERVCIGDPERIKRYNPYRYGVNAENIDKYYFFDSCTGEIVPMFVLVPCGKCELCCEKKKSEWSFRAVCETATSTSMPLFVTLTFAPKYRPVRGVDKLDIQLFMKRLRVRLTRENIEHNIRYFACGEYGSKTKLPHYHLMLWNFPYDKFGSLHKVLDFIERSWSVRLRNRYGDFVNEEDGTPKYEQIGFVYVKPCNSGCASYVMKYMHKSHEVPVGKNPVFFLSSRRNGGIGAEYARRYMDFYRANPEILEMSCTDPYTGRNVRCFMPSYFRNLYFPSLSKIVGSDIRKVYRDFCDSLAVSFRLKEWLGYDPQISLEYKCILLKYSFFPEHPRFNAFTDILSEKMITKDAPDYVIKSYLCEIEENLICLAQVLKQFEPDYVLMDKVEKMRKVRESYLFHHFKDKKALDLNSVKNSIIYRTNLAYDREIL